MRTYWQEDDREVMMDRGGLWRASHRNRAPASRAQLQSCPSRTSWPFLRCFTRQTQGDDGDTEVEKGPESNGTDIAGSEGWVGLDTRPWDTGKPMLREAGEGLGVGGWGGGRTGKGVGLKADCWFW